MGCFWGCASWHIPGAVLSLCVFCCCILIPRVLQVWGCSEELAWHLPCAHVSPCKQRQVKISIRFVCELTLPFPNLCRREEAPTANSNAEEKQTHKRPCLLLKRLVSYCLPQGKTGEQNDKYSPNVLSWPPQGPQEGGGLCSQQQGPACLLQAVDSWGPSGFPSAAMH